MLLKSDEIVLKFDSFFLTACDQSNLKMIFVLMELHVSTKSR